MNHYYGINRNFKKSKPLKLYFLFFLCFMSHNSIVCDWFLCEGVLAASTRDSTTEAERISDELCFHVFVVNKTQKQGSVWRPISKRDGEKKSSCVYVHLQLLCFHSYVYCFLLFKLTSPSWHLKLSIVSHRNTYGNWQNRDSLCTTDVTLLWESRRLMSRQYCTHWCHINVTVRCHSWPKKVSSGLHVSQTWYNNTYLESLTNSHCDLIWQIL